MKTEEILKKAIEKAIENGWNPPFIIINNEIKITRGFIFHREMVCILYKDSYYPIEVLIFSHSFAKAFWGDRYMTPEEEDKEVGLNQTVIMPRWQYHLQKMVLEEDPIKYLEKYL